MYCDLANINGENFTHKINFLRDRNQQSITATALKKRFNYKLISYIKQTIPSSTRSLTHTMQGASF